MARSTYVPDEYGNEVVAEASCCGVGGKSPITLDLAMDLDEFLGTQGETLQRPAMQQAACHAVAGAVDLVSPAIVHGWFPVGDRCRETVEVGGVVFGLGRLRTCWSRPARPASIAT